MPLKSISICVIIRYDMNKSELISGRLDSRTSVANMRTCHE
jgi:hypothetical protein